MTIDNLLSVVKVIREKIVANLTAFFEKNRGQSICRLLIKIHPNSLTLSRATIFPCLVSFSLINGNKTAALIYWIIGWLTDSLDGPWAIVTNQQTKLGKILDPLCDRIYFFSVIPTTLLMDSYIWPIKALLLTALALEMVLPLFYLLAKKIGRPIKLTHNVYGKTKTILIATALPFIWFSEHSENWQFFLGGIISAAIFSSIVNIKKHLHDFLKQES